METEHTTQEISRLRRCINDLTSLLALPAMWTGQGCSRVISTLFAVLIRMLDLDFVYARTEDPADESPSDWMRSADSIDQHAKAKEVGRALEPYLVAEIPTASFRVANPLAEGTTSIAVFHLGVRDRVGVFVAGSRRSEFPSETERLLLQVAINQAAVALQEARHVSKRTHATEELERQVVERTAELTSTNEALRKEMTERTRSEKVLLETQDRLK